MTKIQGSDSLQNAFKASIEQSKLQQKKLEAAAKQISDPNVRKYLEASNKVMKQLDQFDEVVLSKVTKSAPAAKKSLVSTIKSFIKKLF
ncbi:MAG: hypothetical protein PHV37_07720 [Candidatus Gastranaerophilales bacterium]|nr:hypothetical protein [Candidatus Gastranaerophilales bacterium]